jgi:hypothetical protein
VPALDTAPAHEAPARSVAVINMRDGPGEPDDPYYPPVVDRLAKEGVTMLGYVDAAYGLRSRVGHEGHPALAGVVPSSTELVGVVRRAGVR